VILISSGTAETEYDFDIKLSVLYAIHSLKNGLQMFSFFQNDTYLSFYTRTSPNPHGHSTAE